MPRPSRHPSAKYPKYRTGHPTKRHIPLAKIGSGTGRVSVFAPDATGKRYARTDGMANSVRKILGRA